MALQVFAVSFSQTKKNRADLLKARAKSKKEIDSFVKIDFLKKKYQYLDSNFKIKIDSTTFNKAVKKYNYYPKRIKTYRDSLSVILTYELKSFHGSRIAGSRITYQWKKIGYYIWENELTAKKLGNELGFTKPYRFYEFLIDDAKRDAKKRAILTTLKNKLPLAVKDTIDIFPNKRFLKFTFKTSPQRIQDFKNYRKAKNKHKH
ncbi:hypothetical protein BTO18_12880 [Polaribacter porphyrae]|uniref:Uncharacterized protein n=2 Tax=Polaribacter porphyrae TaxID=1137780 RepID=A0A2S7WQY4_9FLAO|nr:hypothetical protein [Polaribacter porphyrae]PQJ80009.1 hypothetical protein BTO18_12880 [Polaribacter porphyrae]